MLKKALSVFMSFVILIVSLSAFSISAYAGTSYSTKLKNKGFSDSYVELLEALHKKYPNWQFEPFNTGLDWNDVVNGERSYHSKQMVQTRSTFNSGYYCSCDNCAKYSSSYERPASESAVAYYLDPRNWINEKYIFQFESTKYNENQTTSGVESIISSTWMSNAYITYKDKDGVVQTYLNEKGNKVKYSTAIMKAAKNSGLSAYYLASKIVQEVGGVRNTAGGASGTVDGYEGIYNYYNIGASTGARAGLKWASNDDYEIINETNLRKKATTDSTVVKKLPAKTVVELVGTTEKQEDGYVWYYVNVTVSGDKYVGYVRSDLVKTPTYNRPWTNPYLSIYNGAMYIANNFKYQYTGYLQKFNVNKSSSSLYSHEYMTTVHAASDEALISYRAYNNANILNEEKVFYIPVYSGMPKKACPAPKEDSNSITNSSTSSTTQAPVTVVSGVKLTSSTTESLTYTWNEISGATKYQIELCNTANANKKYYKETTTNSITLNNLTVGNQYTIRVRAYVKGWKGYSATSTNKTLPDKATGLKLKKVNSKSVSLSWNKVDGADGYIVYYLKGKTYKKLATVSGGSTLKTTVKNLKGGTTYKLRVAAYVGKKRAGAKSNKVTAKTKPEKVTGVKLKPTKTTIKATWSKVGGNAEGYQVSFARDKAFKDKIATRDIEGQKTVSYTGKNFTKGRSYYVRVRAYKTIDKKVRYGPWSSVVKTTCK